MRLAVVGCGAFAHRYHVPALRELPDLELVAIADPLPSDATTRLAAETGAALVADLDGVSADAVLVSSPHALHAVHVEKALLAGMHVLVDKPFVLASSDAIRLAELARSRGLVGAVAFNRRLDPAYRTARSLLAQAILGPVRHVDSTQLGYPRSGWAAESPALAGGGPFVGRGAHLADAVPWLLDREPVTVQARVIPGDPGRVDRGGYWDVVLRDVTWRATILAEGVDMYDEVRIFGDDGWLALRRPPLGTSGSLPDWQLTASAPVAPPGDPAIPALADFATAIDDARDPACTFDEALVSVRLVEAAYASEREFSP